MESGEERAKDLDGESEVADVSRCSLCHEPLEPTHHSGKLRGIEVTRCPSFQEFVLDGRDLVVPSELE